MSLVSFCVSRLKGDAVTVSKEKKRQQKLAKAATEFLPFQLSQSVGEPNVLFPALENPCVL